LKFLCDHNIGSIIARALQAQGHDVERAVQVTPHADDLVVMAYAVAQKRVLITCDSDFGEHVFLRGAEPPPAIIYIRFEPQDVHDIVPRLVAVLDFDSLQGHMTVIGEHRDRRTPFPKRNDKHG
jgi:predicted nuclease of predicted toxin-antitoxin system